MGNECNVAVSQSNVRRLKLILAAIILGIGLVALWYLVGRLEHNLAPIQVTETAAPFTPYSGHLRVAAYNIAHGRGGKLGASNWSNETPDQLRANLDAIAGQINQAAPDIIVLNEIDFHAPWSFGLDQADYLAQKCGYRYVVKQRNLGVSLPFYQLHFGNALLSKYPVRVVEFQRFEPYSAIESLAAGNHDGFSADIYLNDQRLRIYAIHLEYRDEPTRVAAAKAILGNPDNQYYPVIALGDFNSSLDTPINGHGENTIRQFLDAGFVASMPGEDAPDTFPSGNPDRKIDWILGRGVSFINAKVVPSPHSDHLMIVAEVKLASE